jgi:hypothetical protein
MKFKNWLENEFYNASKEDLDKVSKNLNLPSPEQFQFDRIMMQKKFGSIAQKYKHISMGFDYDEKKDTLTVSFPIAQEYVYVNDEEMVFPVNLVQKVVDKYFAQSNLGLIFPGVNPQMKNTPAAMVGKTNPLIPYITQADTGYYELILEFPNASQINLEDLDKRISNFASASEKVSYELDKIQYSMEGD